MTSKKRIWQQLSTSLIVAIGIALVWGMLAGWGCSTVEEILWPRNNVHENIAITNEGTPLIGSMTLLPHRRIYDPRTYRTFDGQPVTVPRGEFLVESSLPAPTKPPGLWHGPVEWRNRIAGISDLGQPPIGWYLIRDNQPSGQAYLVGYDQKSNQLVGYIGRKGFCSSLPAREERFEHDNKPYGWVQGSACSTGYLQHGSVAPQYDWNSANFDRYFPKWMLFLIDGDKLQEVDLRTHKVRTLYQSPNLVGVSFLRTNETAEEDGKKMAKTVRRLMLRLTDRVVILDRSTSDEQEYLLSESMLMQAPSVYALDDGQLLLTSQSYGRGNEGHNLANLVWYSSDGQISQEKEVSLMKRGQSTSKHARAAMAGMVAPIPLAWMAGGGIGTLVMMQQNDVPDYSEELRKAIAEMWPGMIVVLLIGLIAAGIALRLHRKYHRPQTGVWCVFVFLLGPAGLVAYWLGHRRAVLQSCASCGKTVPRDRDGCAACGEAFAPPALVGTEVFA